MCHAFGIPALTKNRFGKNQLQGFDTQLTLWRKLSVKIVRVNKIHGFSFRLTLKIILHFAVVQI